MAWVEEATIKLSEVSMKLIKIKRKNEVEIFHIKFQVDKEFSDRSFKDKYLQNAIQQLKGLNVQL